MLKFFRTYQRFFFLITTIIVVITFSFFGTYQALSGSSTDSKTAFTTTTGTKVSNSELSALTNFLSSDAKDQLTYGKHWVANLLNDGVVRNDLLQTGLAEMLVKNYSETLKNDLSSRFAKEKNYIPYAHPEIPTVNAETAWNYFAPALKTHFNALKFSDTPTSEKSFHHRVKLYLAEDAFPSPLLRQILRYQENQYSWMPRDPALEQTDLSLFGYHSIKDWFGPRFLELMGQFIINASNIAENRGYIVSKEEVMTDLVHNMEMNIKYTRSAFPSANNNELFQEQLRILNIDAGTAIKVWRHVMLFRRLFHEAGNSILTDTMLYKDFQNYADETTTVDLYKLPDHLHFKNFIELQQFETYIQAVSPDYSEAEPSLLLPAEFLSPEEVKINYPELVQKRYLLEIAEVNKGNLNIKVGVKQLLDWELAEENWGSIKGKATVLGIHHGNTREERFSAFSTLDDVSKGNIDSYARTAIVNNHPEWLTDAIKQSVGQKKIIKIQYKGGDTPITGITDGEALIKMLDSNDKEALQFFSADNIHYYKINVLDRSLDEIVPFAEAIRSSALNTIINNNIQNHYLELREKHSDEFKNDDGEWKPLVNIRDKVVQDLYGTLLTAIHDDYISSNISDAKPTGNFGARHRFYCYMRKIQEQLKKGNDSSVTASAQEERYDDKIIPAKALSEQWNLKRTSHPIRKGLDSIIDSNEVFSLNPLEWSKITLPPDGNISFFHIVDRFTPEADVIAKVSQGQTLLSHDAQRFLMHDLLQEISEKNAISLAYSNVIDEEDDQDPVRQNL